MYKPSFVIQQDSPLKRLPLQIRLQAIENIRRQSKGFEVFTSKLYFAEDFHTLFLWDNTKQGYDYWAKVANKYGWN